MIRYTHDPEPDPLHDAHGLIAVKSERISNLIFLLIGISLWSLVPSIDLANSNVNYLRVGDFFITCLVVAGFTAALTAGLAFATRWGARVAIIVFLTNYFLTLIGSGLLIVGKTTTGGVQSSAAMIGLLVLVVLIFAVLITPEFLLTRLIAAIGAALFATSTLSFVRNVELNGSIYTDLKVAEVLSQNPIPPPEAPVGRLPDIIYIVTDRYGSQRVLMDAFGYDNRAFISELERRGFAVASQARANYLKTHYSLASSMNMQFLGPALAALDGRTQRAEPLYQLMQDNLVAQRLKQLGFRYIHVGSWWDGSARNPNADVEIGFGLPRFGGEFGARVLKGNPLLRTIADGIDPATRCRALKRQLAFLEEAAGDATPTFVFAHVLAPHSPILTDQEGNCITPMDYPSRTAAVTWDAFRRAYADYVHYLNQRILDIFDAQKQRNPNPFIFVVQADEGPFPKAYRESEAGFDPEHPGKVVEVFDWTKASDDELAMKFGIMNALYLGEGGALPPVPEALTPVNNWRVIFSRIEGRDYPLLPDRFYIFPTKAEPYRSIDITEHLNSIMTAGSLRP